MKEIIKGLAVSKGIAIGRAFVKNDAEINLKNEFKGAEKEKERLLSAVTESKKQLEELIAKTTAEIGEKEAGIFESHIDILDDPELIDKATDIIEKDSVSAEKAIASAVDSLAAMFAKIKQNDYIKERMADIQDVGTRIEINLSGNSKDVLSKLPENSVVVAHDLKPSETASLDKKHLLAFVTETGGATSHTAIISKAMNIAAIVGAKNIISSVKTGDCIIVDGIAGEIIVRPDSNDIESYKAKEKSFKEEKEKLRELLTKETVTKAGKKIILAANIGSEAQADDAIKNGAEAVGLFRTEFLYMDKQSLPTEDEQFEVYKQVAEKMNGRPVVIRTLDIGGDKDLPYLSMPKELNPFLGLRAIRLCLKETGMFKTQLRALLRASVFGDIQIMFPMIGNMKELEDAKSLLEECKKELTSEGTEYNKDIRVGMMIEVPSAAVMSREFAKKVDFFSIGTNDLTQYTLAVDRLNENISNLYDPMNPAVLKLIKTTIDSAHAEGIICCMCGEMAGNPKAIPTLVEYGLDEFSMSASSIPEAKKTILSC